MDQNKRVEDYANACLKIRALMSEATHRRKHKLLVPVGDLNDALMAFGITKASCEADIKYIAECGKGTWSWTKDSEVEVEEEIKKIGQQRRRGFVITTEQELNSEVCAMRIAERKAAAEK